MSTQILLPKVGNIGYYCTLMPRGVPKFLILWVMMWHLTIPLLKNSSRDILLIIWHALYNITMYTFFKTFIASGRGM